MIQTALTGIALAVASHTQHHALRQAVEVGVQGVHLLCDIYRGEINDPMLTATKKRKGAPTPFSKASAVVWLRQLVLLRRKIDGSHGLIAESRCAKDLDRRLGEVTIRLDAILPRSRKGTAAHSAIYHPLAGRLRDYVDKKVFDRDSRAHRHEIGIAGTIAKMLTKMSPEEAYTRLLSPTTRSLIRAAQPHR